MAIHVAIEGYDSLEQIGVGGMAAVYKARKVSIDKVVAIKVLFPYLATDASFTERFQREAKAAASIQHDNVVNVIDFGECDGLCYIVMEYYDGRTLEDLMKSRPGVPVDVAAQIILEVAYGLEAAHALDIVHRDIKPANIIYTSQGGIKIADFGLAKKSDSVTMITQHGKVIGTPAYMSPEQAAGRPVGPPSDIFSLGVVAYELLGRRKPFEGKTYSDVIEKIQTLEPPAVTEVNPLIDPAFERVIARMLQKEDNDRHANAGALIPDIESAMEASRIPRDRRRLAAYVRDPDAYDASANEKTITQCLSRGAFYLQKGQNHLDDALLEFRRILFLDPTNDRARKNLERIRSRRGDKDRTVTLDAREPAAMSVAAARPVTRTRAGRHARASRRAYALGTAGVAVLVAALLWNARDPGAPIREPRDPSASSMAGRPPLLDELAADSTPVDSSAGAGDAASPSASKPDAPATIASSGRRNASKGASEPSRTNAAAKGVPDKTAAERTVTGGTAADQAATSGTAPEQTPRGAETVRTGTLSVFFLGGVGEVTVNGRPFAHQPPFEGIVMPAGTYRIACRMRGDDAPKEIRVTIAPDRATVVEYEVGGTPVAKIED